jgi:hypothetical protein
MPTTLTDENKTLINDPAATSQQLAEILKTLDDTEFNIALNALSHDELIKALETTVSPNELKKGLKAAFNIISGGGKRRRRTNKRKGRKGKKSRRH